MRKSFALAALFLSAGFAFAQSTEDFEARLRVLEEKVSSGPPAISIPILQSLGETKSQLGPAASKIYFSSAKWQLGLSADFFTYHESEEDRANVLSVAPVLSFRPHRRVIFNSQFLFENGGAESRNTVVLQTGQSIVLMAYVDWLASEDGYAGLRVGHQLVPIGWTNTRHESVTYFSVLRPELERELIPSLWHENGISYWVDRPHADIQIGVFNSLDAREFRKETFMAEGRGQGQNAPASDVMGAVRVNAKYEWFLLGMSLVGGQSAQDDPALRNASFRLAEIHTRWRWQKFELQAQGVRGQIDEADSISVRNMSEVASEADGTMAQIAFNLESGPKALWLFARQSRYNLQAKMPTGFVADKSLDKTATTLGVSYHPLPNLVIKADYAFKKTKTGNAPDEFSLGLGAAF